MNVLGAHYVYNANVEEQRLSSISEYFKVVDMITTEVKELTSTVEGWTFLYQKNQVTAYKKAMKNTNVQCVKGIIDVPLPAEYIKNIIVGTYSLKLQTYIF
jgi:hypothetical protein